MTKTQFFAVAMIALFAISVTSIGQIRFLDDHVEPETEVEMHVNILEKGQEDVKLSVYVPELDIYIPNRGLDIPSNKPLGKMIFYDIGENPEPGEYLVRVRAFSDGRGVSQYRHIIIE